MVIGVSVQGMHVPQPVDQTSDGHGAARLLWQLRTYDHLKG